ncbi:hypothetical protein Poli38472_010171 [Pythium oligandrum]|uniref:C2 domain-containing protein n=1 Tax=Pythium oligandrum TaxID=41045 RepID=A0A8K1C8P3_PYTOL|nr:hypothetical protein Poli38472_010171 [Pythium oligandrum]|eukprot:TMW58612.1 hypothetical protein Poli38472_010171 [Pythium oligandrum]
MGIDLFSWEFDKTTANGETRHYQASIWDLAGQDVYHSSHSLFYSKRTMYIVCVNLEAYQQELEIYNLLDRNDGVGAIHRDMDTFVNKHIYQWVHAVFARAPESEFMFVGTKFDLIDDNEDTANRIMEDLRARLGRKEERELGTIKEALDSLEQQDKNKLSGGESKSLNHKITTLQNQIAIRPKYLENEIYVSSKSFKGVGELREVIKESIIASQTCIRLPDKYVKLDEYLKKMISTCENVEDTIYQAKSLQDSLLNEPSLPITSMEVLQTGLQYLHDLGDILWFTAAQGVLSTKIFFSPKRVIDILCQVVNHKLVDESYVAQFDKENSKKLADKIRLSGCVQHDLLRRLKFWRHMKGETWLELKLLLLEFQLAYPTGDKGMTHKSDLIVPLYWKMSAVRPQSAVAERWECHVKWVYEFRETLPDDFFEKLGVQSYTLYYSTERKFTPDSFTSLDKGRFETVVYKETVAVNEGDYDKIKLSIDVGATTRGIAWRQIVLYSMNIEKLLESHLGLWVKRIVMSENGEELELDQLVSQMQLTGQQPSGNLLPPSMKWYTSRAWSRVDGNMLSDVIESVSRGSDDKLELIVEKLEALTTSFQSLKDTMREDLMGAMIRPQVYPTATLTLKFLSQLSGKCHHEDSPIEFIDNTLLGSYGKYIKKGVSCLWAMVPDSLAKWGAENTIGEWISKQIDIDANATLHNLIEGYKLSENGWGKWSTSSGHESLPPADTSKLFRDLLEAKYGSNVDERKIIECTRLECGVVVKVTKQGTAIEAGTYIWATREEFQERGIDVAFLYDYVRPGPKKAFGLQDNQNEHEELDDTPKIGKPAQSTPVGDISECNSMLLGITRVGGLPNVLAIGKQSPYCKWRFVGSDHAVLACGQTKSDTDRVTTPHWKDVFEVELPNNGAASLDGSTLYFVVKTADFLGFSSSIIAEGAYRLPNKRKTERGRWINGNTDLVSDGAPAGALHFKLMWCNGSGDKPSSKSTQQ